MGDVLPGQYFDAETGLHQNYFRDYDPRTGRYVQADPIGLEGGVNLFTYSANNPINLLDLKGLDAESRRNAAIVLGGLSWIGNRAGDGLKSPYIKAAGVALSFIDVGYSAYRHSMGDISIEQLELIVAYETVNAGGGLLGVKGTREVAKALEIIFTKAAIAVGTAIAVNEIADGVCPNNRPNK